MARNRFQQWRRWARFFSLPACAVWRGVDSIAEFVRARIPEDPPKRDTWKPRPTKLEISAYEPRFMPGSSVGLGLGAIGTGLEILNRESPLAQTRIMPAPAKQTYKQQVTQVPQGGQLQQTTTQPLNYRPAAGPNSGQSWQSTPQPTRDLN